MSIYTEVTINGVTLDAIVLEGTGANAKIILKRAITPTEKAIFEGPIDALEGVTFREKMESFTLPNGRNAYDQYVGLSKTLGQTNNAARLTAAGRASAADFIALQDQVADLQAQLDAQG